MNGQNEADILFAGKEIIINGEVVVIKPYTWVQAAKVAKSISVLLKALLNNIKEIERLTAITAKMPVTAQASTIMEFIGELPEIDEIIGALVEMMTLATGKSQEYIQSLLIDEAIMTGSAIYDVNKAFFTKRLVVMKQLSQTKKQEK